MQEFSLESSRSAAISEFCRRERCSSLAGGLARQKAKDLEQVSDSGDGTTSGLIGKTLKVR
jgi:hypothetical protein